MQSKSPALRTRLRRAARPRRITAPPSVHHRACVAVGPWGSGAGGGDPSAISTSPLVPAMAHARAARGASAGRLEWGVQAGGLCLHARRSPPFPPPSL